MLIKPGDSLITVASVDKLTCEEAHHCAWLHLCLPQDSVIKTKPDVNRDVSCMDRSGAVVGAVVGQEDAAQESTKTTMLWGVDEDKCAFGVRCEESSSLFYGKMSGEEGEKTSDFVVTSY